LTHQNFYDRYYFNGYDREGEYFFSVALGVYPYRNIMDASFSIIVDGVQHNIHTSRVMGLERMDTRVGPISIHVVEPVNILAQRARLWVTPKRGCTTPESEHSG